MDDSNISQVYERMTTIYGKWTCERTERVNESYIAGTIEYIWYVAVIHNVFFINVTLK